MYVCELLWFGARLFPSAAHFSRRRSALTHALSITEWMIDIPWFIFQWSPFSARCSSSSWCCCCLSRKWRSAPRPEELVYWQLLLLCPCHRRCCCCGEGKYVVHTTLEFSSSDSPDALPYRHLCQQRATISQLFWNHSLLLLLCGSIKELVKFRQCWVRTPVFHSWVAGVSFRCCFYRSPRSPAAQIPQPGFIN